MATVIHRWWTAVRRFGVVGLVKKVYQVNELKIGVLMGTDRLGNKYYENRDELHGQHRWVEYVDPHNYDASMVDPNWHGWLHHMTDQVGSEDYIQASKDEKKFLGTVEHSDAHKLFQTHVGGVVSDFTAMHNKTGWRSRGYGVGSIYTTKDQADGYYKQPGHPLHPLAKKGGRFTGLDGDVSFEVDPDDNQWEKRIEESSSFKPLDN